MERRTDCIFRKHRLLPAHGGHAGADAGLPGSLCGISESRRDHHQRGAPVRDLDLFRRLQEEAWIRVYFSIAFADDDLARMVEPQAPSISKRFETMRILSEAGIPTGISLAPIIPGLNEDAIPELLSRAKTAGATTATWSLLRLSGHVEDVFLERMREAFPDRISKIIHRIQEVRGGSLNDTAFFSRHHGQEPTGAVSNNCLSSVVDVPDSPRAESGPQTFRRPQAQQSLFGMEGAL